MYVHLCIFMYSIHVCVYMYKQSLDIYLHIYIPSLRLRRRRAFPSRPRCACLTITLGRPPGFGGQRSRGCSKLTAEQFALIGMNAQSLFIGSASRNEVGQEPWAAVS